MIKAIGSIFYMIIVDLVCFHLTGLCEKDVHHLSIDTCIDNPVNGVENKQSRGHEGNPDLVQNGSPEDFLSRLDLDETESLFKLLNTSQGESKSIVDFSDT